MLLIRGRFSYIEFTEEESYRFNRILMYFVTFVAVYKAGMMAQKYIEAKKKKVNDERLYFRAVR